MIKKVDTVKYNEEYFEHGDLVAVEDTNGNTTIGSIIFGYDGREYEPFPTTSHALGLDISKQFYSKKIHIRFEQKKSIKRISDDNYDVISQQV